MFWLGFIAGLWTGIAIGIIALVLVVPRWNP
jgi:hypothetical protein